MLVSAPTSSSELHSLSLTQTHLVNRLKACGDSVSLRSVRMRDELGPKLSKPNSLSALYNMTVVIVLEARNPLISPNNPQCD